jgi:hypothetical protein
MRNKGETGRCDPGVETTDDGAKERLMAYKAEYIWIDGTEPTAKLRSKTKVRAGDLGI